MGSDYDSKYSAFLLLQIIMTTRESNFVGSAATCRCMYLLLECFRTKETAKGEIIKNSTMRNMTFSKTRLAELVKETNLDNSIYTSSL